MKKVNRRKSDPAIVWEQLLGKPGLARGTISTQLVMSFVSAITSKQIPAGVRVPSSRSLADTLHIGRNTAIAAINSLIEQGYLESRDRSGVFVAATSEAALRPDRGPQASQPYDWAARLSIGPEEPKTGGTVQAHITHNFKYGQFDSSTFPIGHWRQCERSASGLAEIADWGRDMFDLDDAGLVDSLRHHVLPSHGIWAEPEEVLVTLGGQEGRYLVAQLLCTPGVSVGLEQPGLPDMHDIVASTAASRVYLPIDNGGVMLSAELRQCDVAFMTPGHHCPTTAVMPPERRATLLDLAKRRDMILVEDTYETELLSHGRAMPSLKSLDTEGRVIHIGSLSKAVAPGLRIGFIVAAAPVIARLREIRRLIHRHPPGNVQRSLAMFIDRGYYHSYLRRVSTVLDQRSQVLRRAFADLLPDASVKSCAGASSFWVELPQDIDAADLCKEMERRGVLLEAGGRFFAGGSRLNYLRVGVSQVPENKIASGIAMISEAVRRRQPGRPYTKVAAA